MLKLAILAIAIISAASVLDPMTPKNLATTRTLQVVRALSLSATPYLMTQMGSRASASSLGPHQSLLPSEAYTSLGDLRMTRVLNGMWQVSGAHGFDPNRDDSVAAMAKCASEGFTTFDLADIYGPAETYVGDFSSGRKSSSLSEECQFFTKWVPRPGPMDQRTVNDAIDRSLRRMKREQLDLLQFHWWEYDNKYYYDAMAGLMNLRDSATPKIRNIGLTNFDTKHMVDLMDQEAPIVSNQISFSVVDTRPLREMVPASIERNVKLLCYGTLLGGFISDKWLDKPAPDPSTLTNVSLRKYLPWIYFWGGWDLFQELLRVLRSIADKHAVSISNVAVRWVLQQKAVGGAIVGVRLGYSDHVKDNLRLFSFSLDDDDLDQINAVSKKSRDLYSVFGDCGGEYRRRA